MRVDNKGQESEPKERDEAKQRTKRNEKRKEKDGGRSRHVLLLSQRR